MIGDSQSNKFAVLQKYNFLCTLFSIVSTELKRDSNYNFLSSVSYKNGQIWLTPRGKFMIKRLIFAELAKNFPQIIEPESILKFKTKLHWKLSKTKLQCKLSKTKLYWKISQNKTPLVAIPKQIST